MEALLLTLSILFFSAACFETYLILTQQHLYAYTINDGPKGSPLFRYGRLIVSLSYNDEKRSYKYYPAPGIKLSWHLFYLSELSLGIICAGDEMDIRFAFGFLFGKIWLSIEGTRFFRWLFKKVYRMGWGRETSIEFDPRQWEFRIYFWYNDMASGSSPRIRVPKWKWLYRRKREWILSRPSWSTEAKGLNLKHLEEADHLEINPLPSWIHFWPGIDYMKGHMPTGGGFRLSFDFAYLVMGSYERIEKPIAEPITAEVPIEPDNSLGYHYFGTFTRKQETRWRGNWPRFKKVNSYWDIEFKEPPMHSGKGENSYDQDDDGIFGCASMSDNLQGAIEDYAQKVYRDRKKYGMPGNIHRRMLDDSQR